MGRDRPYRFADCAFARTVLVASVALATSLTVSLSYADAQIVLSDERVVLRSELGINTAQTDYGPALYREGLIYVSPTAGSLKKRFKSNTSRKPAQTRLWYATRLPGGELSDAEPFLQDAGRKVNTGPVSFSSDGREIYLTRNATGGRRKGRVATRLQIYRRVSSDAGRWGDPEPVDFADATSNDAHPALSTDGSLLIFVSDRDGGFGGLDLWGVRREGETWGAPFNLGLGVNSGGNESFPFLHADGTLYYSSTVGGEAGAPEHLDIFYARQEDEGWTEPVRLGDPFNGPADDFGIVVASDNASGYFSSARGGGVGDDDIYSFEIIGAAANRQSAELAIQVTDALTGAALQGAAVRYLNTDATSLTNALETGIVSVVGDPLQVVGGDNYMTDITGRGLIRTVAGTYLLEVSREGYEPVQIPLVLRTTGTSLPIVLSPKRACSTIRVSVLDQQSLLPVSAALLTATTGVVGETERAIEPDTRTGADGTAKICLPCGEVFALVAASGGLKSKPIAYSTRSDDCGKTPVLTTVTMYVSPRSSTPVPAENSSVKLAGNPLSAGTRLQLPSVYYALNESKLSAEARGDLDELAALMLRFVDMRVELGSHTDAIGNAAFNRQLSQRRADEAKRYLIEKAGIDPVRVVAKGYGETHLRNGCRDGVPCSAAQHRENRRTEVVILDKDGKGAELSLGFVPTGRGGSNSSASARTPEVPSERVTSGASVPGSGGSYFVFAGSFPGAMAATARLQELRDLGYEGVRVQKVVGRDGLTVIAGRFDDAAKAQNFARALQEAHGIEASVERE